MTDQLPVYEGERPKLTLKEVVAQVPPHLRGEAMLDLCELPGWWVEHRSLELKAPDLVTQSPEESWRIIDEHVGKILEQEPDLIDESGSVNDRLLPKQTGEWHPIQDLPIVPSQIRIKQRSEENILCSGFPVSISKEYAEYFIARELGPAQLDKISGIINIGGDGKVREIWRERIAKKPGLGSWRYLSCWNAPVTLYQTPIEGLLLYKNPHGVYFLTPEIRALDKLEEQLRKVPSERDADHYMKKEISIAVREEGLSFTASFGQLDVTGIFSEIMTGQLKRELAEKIEKARETNFGKRILRLKEKLICIVDEARQHVPGEALKPVSQLDLGREKLTDLKKTLVALQEYFVLLDRENLEARKEDIWQHLEHPKTIHDYRTRAKMLLIRRAVNRDDMILKAEVDKVAKSLVCLEHPQWRAAMSVLNESEKTGVLDSANAGILSGNLTSLAILYCQLSEEKGG